MRILTLLTCLSSLWTCLAIRLMVRASSYWSPGTDSGRSVRMLPDIMSCDDVIDIKLSPASTNLV